MDEFFYQFGRLAFGALLFVLAGGLIEFGKALCRKLFNIEENER